MLVLAYCSKCAILEISFNFLCLPASIHYNETDLLRQVTEGHEQAFGQLFHRYHQQLGAYIYQLTSSREQAEEVVQDVFLKIWINRANLGRIENFNTWLWVVSRNHALNAIRKVIRENMRQSEFEKLQPTASTTEEMISEEQFQLIDQAIRQLPPQQKKVFIMSRYGRLKYDEIAREMNISKETVKSYLQTAVSSIRKFVGSRLPMILLALVCCGQF
ncbi:MAG: RNA polymerase sigma-70 factor [Sphingobacteriales bacterium]|nr:MAG: RNA polymerase sigma-70 factor [Sphingobacteriales bacterium]